MSRDELEIHAATARKLLASEEWQPTRLLWARLVGHLEASLAQSASEIEALQRKVGELEGQLRDFADKYDAEDKRVDTEMSALEARIEQLEAALRPFAEAAEFLQPPDEEPDFKIVAHVPGGRHAADFKKMANNLTAGNFRAARSVLSSSPDTTEADR